MSVGARSPEHGPEFRSALQVGTWAANTGTLAIAALQIGDNDARTAEVNWDAVVVTNM